MKNRECAHIIAAILLLVFAVPALAQTLKADLTPLTLRIKANAATPALVDFKYSGVALLEGTLEVRVRDESGNHLLTTRVPDIALTAGSQTFRVMLPAMANHVGGLVHADMLFLTRSGAYPVGTRQLMVSTPTERALSVGIIQGEERADDKLLDVIRGLRLDRFDPEKDATENRPAGRVISTYQAYIAADDAPTTPAGCCCFDLICVTPRAFCLLRERQLDALLVWVRAGGSLCVFPGADIKQYHLEFLNKLAGGERFGLSGKGEIVANKAAGGGPGDVVARSETGGGEPFLRRVELGRAAVAIAPAPANDWPGWRRVTAFLWKARKAQMDGMIAKNAWDANQSSGQYADMYGGYQYGGRPPPPGGIAGQPVDQRQRLATAMPVTLNATNNLVHTLAPRQVRIIPFWLVGVLLAGFLILIGPVDYFVLGWVRRRRYTWVTLPVYCVAFTALFVGLSRHYIGGSDHRRSLIIQDEDADGNVLRASRIEMIFTAANRRVVIPAANSLAAAVSTAGQEYYGGYDDRRNAKEPPDYVGRYPASYQIEQPMQQWTYRVYRFLALEPARAGMKINWKGAGPTSSNLVDALVGNSAGLDVMRFHAAEAVPLIRHTFGGANDVVPGNVVFTEFSVHPQVNLFSLVSQLSPSGTPAMEDLAVLDPSDPSQWLVIAVETSGDDIIVHRHLYCTEGQ